MKGKSCWRAGGGAAARERTDKTHLARARRTVTVEFCRCGRSVTRRRGGTPRARRTPASFLHTGARIAVQHADAAARARQIEVRRRPGKNGCTRQSLQNLSRFHNQWCMSIHFRATFLKLDPV
eukprot:1158434-Pleurochrysis_carterae.AAC.1